MEIFKVCIWIFLAVYLIFYIYFFVKIKNIKLVIIFNINSILEQEQISLLLKQFKYMQINVLFINRTEIIEEVHFMRRT